MSLSAGTGSPLNFRCAACRRREGAYRGHDSNAPASTGWQYQLTGRSRPYRPSAGHALGTRSSTTAYEYKCDECGHVGWSAHRDVEQRAAAKKET